MGGRFTRARFVLRFLGFASSLRVASLLARGHGSMPDRSDLYQRFAAAYLANGGKQSAAAAACGYKPGPSAASAGFDLSRHPEVLKILHRGAAAQLEALVPKAVDTMSKLMTAKSAFVRLEAAKDVLNRNGVGRSDAPLKTQPLIVNINLDAAPAAVQPSSILQMDLPPHPNAQIDQGVENRERAEGARSPAHDFSQKVIEIEPDPSGETIPQKLLRDERVARREFDL